MALFKKLFCCKVCKLGSYIIGIWQMLYYTTVMTQAINMTNKIAYSKVPHASLYASTLAMLTFTTGLTVAGVVLLIGLYLSRKCYILPFLICSFSCLVCDFAMWIFIAIGKLTNGTVYNNIFTMTDIFIRFLEKTAKGKEDDSFINEHESTPLSILLIDLVVVVINTYTFLYIFAYYQTLEEASIMRRTERTVAIHHDEISGESLNSIQFSPDFSINSDESFDRNSGIVLPSYSELPLPDSLNVRSCSETLSIVGQESTSVLIHREPLDVLNIDSSLFVSVDNQSVEKDTLPSEIAGSVSSEHYPFFIPEVGIRNENFISTESIAPQEIRIKYTQDLSKLLTQLSIGQKNEKTSFNTKENENVKIESVLNLSETSKTETSFKTKTCTECPPIPPRSFTFSSRNHSNKSPEMDMSPTNSPPPPSYTPPPLILPRFDSKIHESQTPPRPPPRVLNLNTVPRKYLMRQKTVSSNSQAEESDTKKNPKYRSNAGSHLMGRFEDDKFDKPEEVYGGSISISNDPSSTEETGQACGTSNLDSDQGLPNVQDIHREFYKPRIPLRRCSIKRSDPIMCMVEFSKIPESSEIFRRELPSHSNPPHSVAWTPMNSLGDIKRVSTPPRLCQGHLSPPNPPHKVLWPLDDPPLCDEEYVTLTLPVNVANRQLRLSSPPATIANLPGSTPPLVVNVMNRPVRPPPLPVEVVYRPRYPLPNNVNCQTRPLTFPVNRSNRQGDSLPLPSNDVNRLVPSFPLLNIGAVGGTRPKLPTVEKGKRKMTGVPLFRKDRLMNMFNNTPWTTRFKIKRGNGKQFMTEKRQAEKFKTICDNFAYENDPEDSEGATGGQPLPETSQKTHATSAGAAHEPKEEKNFRVYLLASRGKKRCKVLSARLPSPFVPDRLVKAMTEDSSKEDETKGKKEKKKDKNPSQGKDRKGKK